MPTVVKQARARRESAVLGLSPVSLPVRPAQRADNRSAPLQKNKKGVQACPRHVFPTASPRAVPPHRSAALGSGHGAPPLSPAATTMNLVEPAGFIDSRADRGQFFFCSACKEHGSEARRYSHWQALPTMGPGEHRAEVTTARAFIVTLPGDAGSDWTVRTWASTAEQAARQVCDWQAIPMLFARAVRPDA
jgi:hypothetical protein